MEHKMKLSMALEPLHVETGADFTTQDMWWSDIFYSYCYTPGNEAISHTYVSKYRHGKRTITAKYLRYYSSIPSLRVPPKLVRDLQNHLGNHATSAQLCHIYAGMIEYCQLQNSYDRKKMLPEVLEDKPDVETTATLCAVVIWHAMCYDVAHAA